MFRISLKDVGEDRVSKDITVDVSSYQEAERFADLELIIALGSSAFRWQEITLREYEVIRCDIPVGSFTITKL